MGQGTSITGQLRRTGGRLGPALRRHDAAEGQRHRAHERDPAKARARNARLLEECGGTVRDTPRQDILPRLESGLLSAVPGAARGSLFPQPWLNGGTGQGRRMDDVAGHGWRLVLAAGLELPEGDLMPGLTVVALGEADDAEGVVTNWFQRHECVAALVRPDNYVYGVSGSAAGIVAMCKEAVAALGLSTCTA
jgi:3-(3-hydroxy-phenyl)propionate hydroxylase